MRTTVLDRAMLWLGDGRSFVGHVVMRDGKIESVQPGPYVGPHPTTDLSGMSVSPGLIDLMVCGAFGKGFLRDDPAEIARAYLPRGVTACQFASGSLPWPDLVATAQRVDRSMRDQDTRRAARILGVYFEGPFKDPGAAGAALATACVPATPKNVQRAIRDFGDCVPMMTVSPGIEGDSDAVRVLRNAGKVVTMSHSAAAPDRVFKCIDAGAQVLGHIWNNNCGALIEPGVQQPTMDTIALLDEHVRWIHVVCDGVHVHPAFVRLVERCRGAESICLVTDSQPVAGMEDGFQYTQDDGQRIRRVGGAARGADSGLLFGSALLLPDHFRNFVRFTGVSPASSIRTVTHNPAACLGVQDRMGLIAPGRDADLVCWDSDLNVTQVWRAGAPIMKSQHEAVLP